MFKSATLMLAALRSEQQALFNYLHTASSPAQASHYTAARTSSPELSCDTQRDTIAYLFFSLCLLHIVSPHLDARSEDAPGEIGHVDPQEVGHLLSS